MTPASRPDPRALSSSRAAWSNRVFDVAATPMLLVGPRGRVLRANPASPPHNHVDDLAASASDRIRLRDGLKRAWDGHDARVGLEDGTAVSLRPLLGGLVLAEVLASDPDAHAAGSGDRAARVEAPLAHEVRTTLSELVGHLEILQRAPLSSVQHARLACALEAADTLARQFGESAEPVGTSSVPGDRVAARRVLVVDDDETSRQLILTMLGALGHDAEAAPNVPEGLALLEAQSFDVVLMDVMMPGIGGLEATREIRARHGAELRVVALTALPDARERCLDAGMDAFLTKPVRLRTLSEAIAPQVEA